MSSPWWAVLPTSTGHRPPRPPITDYASAQSHLRCVLTPPLSQREAHDRPPCSRHDTQPLHDCVSILGTSSLPTALSSSLSSCTCWTKAHGPATASPCVNDHTPRDPDAARLPVVPPRRPCPTPAPTLVLLGLLCQVLLCPNPSASVHTLIPSLMRTSPRICGLDLCHKRGSFTLGCVCLLSLEPLEGVTCLGHPVIASGGSLRTSRSF